MVSQELFFNYFLPNLSNVLDCGCEIIQFRTHVWKCKIGTIPLKLLILLITGSFIGGYLGAHLSKLKGNILIKKAFTTVCFLVGVSLSIKSIMSFLLIN